MSHRPIIHSLVNTEEKLSTSTPLLCAGTTRAGKGVLLLQDQLKYKTVDLEFSATVEIQHRKRQKLEGGKCAAGHDL